MNGEGENVVFHRGIEGHRIFAGIAEDEIRALEKGRKKEENMLREQMHDFAYRFLFVLCAVVSLLYFFRYSLFPKGSIEYYIFANEWARGFHIFSFTRCLIYIAVAVFVLATVPRLHRC